jgi:hypothetical protein
MKQIVEQTSQYTVYWVNHHTVVHELFLTGDDRIGRAEVWADIAYGDMHRVKTTWPSTGTANVNEVIAVGAIFLRAAAIHAQMEVGGVELLESMKVEYDRWVQEQIRAEA